MGCHHHIALLGKAPFILAAAFLTLATLQSDARAAVPPTATTQSTEMAAKVVTALRDLKNPKISAADKDERISEVVHDIRAALPAMKDPFALVDGAALMMNKVLSYANRLEFWGDSPVLSAEMQGPARAVYLMLDKAGADAKAQAALLAPKITPLNQSTVGAKWERLDNLSMSAEYSLNMMAYYLAISVSADLRPTVADPSLKYLKTLDNKDSTVMPAVHLMMGKLHQAKGEWDEAIPFFNAVATRDAGIVPAPSPEQVYDARYSSAVTQLLAGRLDSAQAGLEELVVWQKTEIPSDANTQSGIRAAAAMLRYRICLARSNKAEGAARKALESDAEKILQDLGRDRPDLGGVIEQERVDRFPTDVPIASVEPAMLAKLMYNGNRLAVALKSSLNAPVAPNTIFQRGLEAAQELLARKNAPAITPKLKDDAARSIGLLLDAMDRRLEAARAYFKYGVDNRISHPQFAVYSLNDGAVAIIRYRKKNPSDKDALALGHQIVSAFRLAAASPNDSALQTVAKDHADELEKLLSRPNPPPDGWMQRQDDTFGTR
jgi:hypothetical protein